MGLIFEQMCRDYLLFHCDILPIEVGEIGQWWGNNNSKRMQAQIDVMLTSPDGKTAIFGECKFQKDLVDTDVLDLLVENGNLFGEIREKHYYIFSKSGFTDRLINKANEDGVTLVSLDKMYEYIIWRSLKWVDELHFMVPGVIKDVEKLKALFELFSEVLNRLCEIGAAYEGSRGVML